jgi:hypothetical protein
MFFQSKQRSVFGELPQRYKTFSILCKYFNSFFRHNFIQRLLNTWLTGLSSRRIMARGLRSPPNMNAPRMSRFFVRMVSSYIVNRFKYGFAFVKQLCLILGEISGVDIMSDGQESQMM